MSMLTPQGFKRKRYAEIFESLERRAKEELGEDKNTSQRSFLGIILRLVAWFLSLFAQDLEDTYNANFADTAEGVALDRNAKRQGAERQRALRAIGEITIEGAAGVRVASGFVVGTIEDIRFQTTRDVRLNSDGVAIAPIQAIDPGSAGNAPAGSITEIINPQVGVDSVVNLLPTSGGRERESDTALRQRLDRTKKGDNQLTYNLLNVEGVRDVYLDSNEEIVEVDGLPPKSVAPVVWGGDEQEVVETIFRYKGAGIQSFGDIYVDVVDSKQRTHPIGYSRPIEVPIYVRATLTVNSDFNSLTEARSVIIEYIGGRDEDGTEYDGLGINSDVIAFRAAMAVGELEGVEDVDIQLSTDGETFSYSNIPISRKELSVTDWEKVVVS